MITSKFELKISLLKKSVRFGTENTRVHYSSDLFLDKELIERNIKEIDLIDVKNKKKTFINIYILPKKKDYKTKQETNVTLPTFINFLNINLSSKIKELNPKNLVINLEIIQNKELGYTNKDDLNLQSSARANIRKFLEELKNLRKFFDLEKKNQFIKKNDIKYFKKTLEYYTKLSDIDNGDTLSPTRYENIINFFFKQNTVDFSWEINTKIKKLKSTSRLEEENVLFLNFTPQDFEFLLDKKKIKKK